MCEQRLNVDALLLSGGSYEISVKAKSHCSDNADNAFYWLNERLRGAIQPIECVVFAS